MSEQITLTGAILSRPGQAPVQLRPRVAAFLRALLVCAPGYVTDRILAEIGGRPDAPSSALAATILDLRARLREIGLIGPILRITDQAGRGYAYRGPAIAVTGRG